MNPHAIAMWILLACIGWLINDTTGAVTGFAIGLVLSFASEIADSWPNK